MFALLLLVPGLVSTCDEPEVQPWQNHAPRVPSLSGPDSALAGLPASFDVAVFDEDGHAMVVFVAWGDGATTDYGDFVPSEAIVEFEHTWHRAGAYDVSAACYDVYDPRKPLHSGWSTPLRVEVTGSGGR